jgi:hypothetical protein
VWGGTLGQPWRGSAVTSPSQGERARADESSLHLLDAKPAVASTSRRDLVLAVSAPRAAPGLDTAAMAYVRTVHALDHYATHRWADAPARMLGGIRRVAGALSGLGPQRHRAARARPDRHQWLVRLALLHLD